MGGLNAYIPTERPRPSLRSDILDMLRRGAALTAAEIAARRGARKADSVTHKLAELERDGDVVLDVSTGERRWRIARRDR